MVKLIITFYLCPIIQINLVDWLTREVPPTSKSRIATPSCHLFFIRIATSKSITKKHNASFNSSIGSSLMSSTPTFPKQPILPTNDVNAIVVSRSLSEDPSRAVNFYIEKKLRGFKFDMGIYPSLIYACVRVNSIRTAYYLKKGLNLHVDFEELSLTTKVLRGEKVERSKLCVAAIAGKHLFTINNFMRAFNMVKHDWF